MTWLRSRGEDDAAMYAETGGVASALLSTGRLTELDTFVSGLVARHRAQGPPTLLYVTLALLAYSALFQGRADAAERLFDESASIEVPPRTSSVNEPARARKAFKNGQRSQAFRILRSLVQELLETDYTELGKLAAVEFVNMMSAINRFPEGARILSYLAATGDVGTLAVRELVADAARKIKAEVPPGRSSHRNLISMHARRWSTCQTYSADSPINSQPIQGLTEVGDRRGAEDTEVGVDATRAPARVFGSEVALTGRPVVYATRRLRNRSSSG